MGYAGMKLTAWNLNQAKKWGKGDHDLEIWGSECMKKSGELKVLRFFIKWNSSEIEKYEAWDVRSRQILGSLTNHDFDEFSGEF